MPPGFINNEQRRMTEELLLYQFSGVFRSVSYVSNIWSRVNADQYRTWRDRDILDLINLK